MGFLQSISFNRQWVTTFLLLILMSLFGIGSAFAWVVCPECNPPVQEISNYCEQCGCRVFRKRRLNLQQQLKN